MATNFYLEITIHFTIIITNLYISWALPIWPPLASVMHAICVMQLVFRSVIRIASYLLVPYNGVTFHGVQCRATIETSHCINDATHFGHTQLAACCTHWRHIMPSLISCVVTFHLRKRFSRRSEYLWKDLCVCKKPYHESTNVQFCLAASCINSIDRKPI